MYNIKYSTHCGYENEITVIEEQFALFYFKSLIKAVDAHEVVMIDGFTGEVIMMWTDGDFSVLNGVIL